MTITAGQLISSVTIADSVGDTVYTKVISAGSSAPIKINFISFYASSIASGKSNEVYNRLFIKDGNSYRFIDEIMLHGNSKYSIWPDRSHLGGAFTLRRNQELYATVSASAATVDKSVEINVFGDELTKTPYQRRL